MVIQVSQLVPYATTNEQGEVLLKAILGALNDEEKVTVSFEGISVVTSSFTNVAFGSLLEHIEHSDLTKRVKISKSSKFINDLIRRSVKSRTKMQLLS